MGCRQADLFPDSRGFDTRPARYYPTATPRHLLPEILYARSQWPPFENPIDTGTAEENIAFQLLPRLSKLRGISCEGLKLAADRGLLRFGAHAGSLVWVVTDGERVNSQVRRMDGQPWSEIGDKKAWTLKGSWASWPLGSRESVPYKTILLTEGAPDLLAAHDIIHRFHREHDVAAVAMLGSGNHIPDEGLMLLAGKRIRIAVHCDPAGDEAGAKWKSQLQTVGATVDRLDLRGLMRHDGKPVEDLNDAVLVRSEDAETLNDILP